MEVDLTLEQKVFTRRAIESGRLNTERDAVREALTLWEERESQRAEFLLSLDQARASIERGEGIEITEDSMRDLADGVNAVDASACWRNLQFPADDALHIAACGG